MFQPTGLSLEIFKSRYAFTQDETWAQACARIARQMAMAEGPDKQTFYQAKFEEILNDNLFVPGGRIWYNSGRLNPQLLNCFVLNDELDSKQGWGNLAYEMIVTSMTGGGCGIDFSDIRPDKAAVGSGGMCPGPVSAMMMLDGCAEPVKSGGGRRVALMFSLNLNHPNVEQFLDAKLVKGKLTHANVSVRSLQTTDFIEAVDKDLDWELSWKGQYKSKIKARSLWDKIVQNAHASAEPGFLNWELVEQQSNIYYIEPLSTTNPCGEIALSPYDCCCLGHLVLSRFVVDGEINWHKLADTVRLGVRFLDNVLTVNTYPLPEMKEKSHKLRRIGLGTTALADTLAMLGFRYGSEAGNAFTDKLYKFIAKTSYEASVLLAVEKGAFPACIPAKHIESGFMKRMPKKIRSLVAEHGIRNCAILTQAPTGTVSLLSGNCSSGIEPIFAPAYERRWWVGDERKSQLIMHPLFSEFMEAGKDVDHFLCSHELSVEQHLEVQKTVQYWVDNAVSKTINMPEDYSVDDMAAAWLKYLPHLKGTTFYRTNSRGYVDAEGKVHEPPLVAIPLEDAKRRFNETKTIEAAQVDDCASGTCEI